MKFRQGAAALLTAAGRLDGQLHPGRLPGVLTVFLTGSGGINSVIDDTGAAVASGRGGPSDVVTHP